MCILNTHNHTTNFYVPLSIPPPPPPPLPTGVGAR